MEYRYKAGESYYKCVGEWVDKESEMTEVRKLGKPSCTRRPLDIDEFKWIIKLLREEKHPMKRYGFAAIICVQFHFVARIDDTC